MQPTLHKSRDSSSGRERYPQSDAAPGMVFMRKGSLCSARCYSKEITMARCVVIGCRLMGALRRGARDGSRKRSCLWSSRPLVEKRLR